MKRIRSQTCINQHLLEQSSFPVQEVIKKDMIGNIVSKLMQEELIKVQEDPNSILKESGMLMTNEVKYNSEFFLLTTEEAKELIKIFKVLVSQKKNNNPLQWEHISKFKEILGI